MFAIYYKNMGKWDSEGVKLNFPSNRHHKTISVDSDRSKKKPPLLLKQRPLTTFDLIFNFLFPLHYSRSAVRKSRWMADHCRRPGKVQATVRKDSSQNRTLCSSVCVTIASSNLYGLPQRQIYIWKSYARRKQLFNMVSQLANR